MKKYFKLAAIAVVALSLTVACKQKPAEEPIDTMPVVEDTTIIDTLIEEVVEEVVEPVKQVAKTTAKKADQKVTEAKEMTKDAADNTKGRLAKNEGVKKGISEAPATKDAPAAPEQNAENRLKKR